MISSKLSQNTTFSARGYRSRKHGRGLGLIEVMIALMVFALGITALLKVQTALLKATSLAQARSTAIQLAEAKLEDLRTFIDYDNSNSAVYDFVGLANNTGGSASPALSSTGGTCSSNPEQLTTEGSRTIAVGNTLYSRNWCITNYYYNGTTLTTTATGLIAQKAIWVHIGWADSDGTSQSVIYRTVINRDGQMSGGNIAFGTGGSGEKALIPYTPSTDTRVTPISVGTDAKRETLVPNATTVDGYVSTSFQSYVYSSSNILIRKEEFKNVACSCAFNGTSSDASQTRAPSYPAWDTTKGTYVDVTGPLVSGKAKGCVDANENGNCDSNPSIYCEICCQDHHDVPNTNTAVTRKNYDPYRSGDVNSDGTAKKYRGTATPVTSGTYYDACRLKRIDGYWRVYQDWHMANFVALPISDLTDSSKKAIYSNYVKSVLDGIVVVTNATNGQTSYTAPTFPSELNHTTSTNRVSLSVGESKESTARSVYVDYVDDTFLTQIQAKKTANQDYLLHLPFYEVDTTTVATWESGSSSSVRVGPYDGPGSSNDLASGQIRGLATNTSPVSIGATLRKSNSGLTGLSVSVDYNASVNADTTTLSSSYDVCIGCSGGTTGASCSHTTGTLLDGVTRTVYAESTGTCTAGSITCTNGTLSGNTGYQYSSCSATTTCVTSISGKTQTKDDTVTASDGTTSVTCSVANSKNYTCPNLTTSTSATISVTRNSSTTATLTTICGAQTVNF